ncbi:MAG: acyltransferase [Puia sp.]|nr:acyltransferase [Puia sp.]
MPNKKTFEDPDQNRTRSHSTKKHPGNSELVKTDPREHIPALDGLRGLAIGLVLIWHFVVFSHRWLPSWIGVDLFFVLSGYLITGRLIGTKEMPGYFSRFYRNRALRILPLYFLVIMIFFGAARFLLDKKNLPTIAIYIDHWRSFFLFTQNWTFSLYGRPQDLSLLPLWSVAVEEQLYLVWPLLIFLFPIDPKTGIRIFATAIFLVVLTRCCYYIHDPSFAPDRYYNTFFRADSMMTGGLLYLLHIRTANTSARMVSSIRKALLCVLLPLSVGCILVIGNTYPANFFFATVGYTITALLFACLLDDVIRFDQGHLNRFFRCRWLRFLGKISYGLYLIHYPILTFLRPRIRHWEAVHWPGHPSLELALSECICLLLAVVLSAFSYRYFESRFLRLKR